MSKLQSIPNTELSDYCINILARHDIFNVVEFVRENCDKLMKILNLNADQVLAIKKELKRVYGPVPTCLSSLQDELYYTTHIGPLDDALGECAALGSQSVWEICGPSGVGKTQLAFTLVANFVQLHHSEALYIDTKLDFLARRVKNILSSRQLPPEVVAGCLQAIKVERVHSAQGVVEMLDIFYKNLQKGSRHVNDIKLVVVDSLPSVWFPLRADTNRLAGRWLLSRLANIAYRISKEYQVCFIFVNLSVRPTVENDDEGEDEVSLLADDEDENITADKGLYYRQVMGLLWSPKPHMRLSVEYKSESHTDKMSTRRIIKILQSYSQTSASECCVRLCEQGVV